MAEFNINGNDLLNWIQSSDQDLVCTTLIGCGVDDGESFELFEIEKIDFANKCIECRNKTHLKKFSFPKLSQIEVVDERDGLPLREAINGSKSDWQRSLDQARVDLKKLGVNTEPIQNTDDIFLIQGLFHDHTKSILPTRNQRDKGYNALKKWDLLRIGVKLCERWRQLSTADGEKIEPDIFIKLAYCLRHTGRLEESYRVTEIVELPRSVVALSPMQRSILATIRAAILIDQYDLRPERKLLKQARSYAALAWANTKSEETSLVYKRLEKRENSLHETDVEEKRIKSLRRIADPNDLPAHKR
jgi:hypothetical protein